MEMYLELCLIVFVGTIIGGAHFQQICSDLDAVACQLLNKSQPDFCNTSHVADTACKRFCGKCPLRCYHCPEHLYTDPRNCTTTKLCLFNETCMINTRTAHDGYKEHVMICGNPQVCEGFGMGFNLIGKRNLNQHGISVHCCNDDLCNVPGFVPTTTQSIPMTPFPPVQGCHKDILFVVDESTSMGLTTFKSVVFFIRDLISRMDISSHEAQVALLLFDQLPRIQWYLNEYITKADLLNAFSYVPYHPGNYSLELALQFAREHVLQYDHGDRLSAQNVAVVIIGGSSNSYSAIISQVRKLQAANTTTIAIGVANAPITNLHDIAKDDHSISVADVHLLSEIEYRVLSLICDL